MMTFGALCAGRYALADSVEERKGPQACPWGSIGEVKKWLFFG